MAARQTGLEWLFEHAAYAGDDCLIWPLTAKNWNGYGFVSIGGKAKYAHRTMCRFAHGEPPTPKHHAAHSCNNGHNGCVNPRHLSWKHENLIDRRAAGTVPDGKWSSKGSLTERDVAKIMALKGKKNQREIGTMFGLSYQHISYIHNGRLRRRRAA